MEARALPRLLLELAKNKVELRPGPSNTEGVALCLGKSPSNDLVQENKSASRHHAQIEFKNNDFYLIDNSTNGTYVQTEDELVTCVHRSQMRLWGRGWISLGEPPSTNQPIFFNQIAAQLHAVG